MSTLKINGPIKVASLASDPAGAEEGYIYFNSTTNNFQMYQSGSFATIVDQSIIDGLVATDIAYERVDGSKKNIQASSDEVESALTDLDDAVGSLEASPSNYTPTDAGIVSDHLSAIDTALATSGSTEFDDTEFKVFDNTDNTKKIQFELSPITTGNTRTILMADEIVDLGNISLNNAKVSADGSVTSHSDITSAGSGDIITSVERSKLAGIEDNATADQTDGEIKTAYENNADTNAYTDSEKTKLAGIESGATADQSGTEIKVAYESEPDTNAYTDTEKTKLSGVEALADVTDSTNVAAAGATMDADTDVSSNGWVLDEDNMVSDDNTKVPTQQSVKAYVDNEISSSIASSKSYQGGYDAATNTPDLDSTPIAGIVKGDAYDVTVAGTFFSAEVEPGDMMTARVDNPTSESDWVIVQANLTPSSIKSQYESNADTNAFTDAEKTKLTGVESGATADQTGAEIKAAYEAEADTNAFTDAEQTKLAGIEAGATGDMTDGEIKTAYENNADTNAFTDAEKSALATKISNIVEDTTPELGGDLEVGSNAIEGASNDVLLAGQNSVKRAKQASKSSFIEEEYIHSITMTGSQTDTVISDLTFAHATVEGLEISYKVKESTSNDIKIGTIRCVTNGTNVVLNEMSTETADTGITFSAAINGANVEIRYSSGTNGATMRADVKKFLA